MTDPSRASAGHVGSDAHGGRTNVSRLNGPGHAATRQINELVALVEEISRSLYTLGASKRDSIDSYEVVEKLK